MANFVVQRSICQTTSHAAAPPSLPVDTGPTVGHDFGFKARAAFEAKRIRGSHWGSIMMRTRTNAMDIVLGASLMNKQRCPYYVGLSTNFFHCAVPHFYYYFPITPLPFLLLYKRDSLMRQPSPRTFLLSWP